MGERVNNSVRNIMFGTVNRIIWVFAPFVFRTIIIYVLGEEYLGLNNLFASVLQVLNIADIGIGSAISASLYKPLADNDTKTVSALLHLYRTVYRWIGAAIIIAAIILSPYLPNLIKGTPPADVNIYLLFALYVANTVSSYLFFAYKVTLLNALQRMDRVVHVETVSKLITSALQLIVLLKFKSITAYVACNVFCVIIENLGCSWIVDHEYPQYTCEGKVSEKDKKKITTNILALALQKVGNTVSVTLDTVIISRFLGLTAVAAYSNYYYVGTAVGAFIIMLFNAIVASIGDSIAQESSEKNYRDFLNISFMNLWCVGWCSICLLCLSQNFMRLWTGTRLLLNDFTMIMITLCFFVTYIRKPVLTYKDAGGMWKMDQYKPLIGCVFNLIVNIILVQRIGIAGVVISTIASYVLIEQPWETSVLFHHYFKGHSVRKYYMQMGTDCLIFAGTACLTYLLCSLIPYSLTGFLVRGLVCIVVPNAGLVLVFRKRSEFASMRRFLDGMLVRVRKRRFR